MNFQMHERLVKDLAFVKDLTLSRLMLYPSTENPWVVLVPRRDSIKEWYQLSLEDQSILCREISEISQWMENKFTPDKINVGALGNMVPQFHVHIIARYKSDKAWPGSIWGVPQDCDGALFDEWKLLFTESFVAEKI